MMESFTDLRGGMGGCIRGGERVFKYPSGLVTLDKRRSGGERIGYNGAGWLEGVKR